MPRYTVWFESHNVFVTLMSMCSNSINLAVDRMQTARLCFLSLNGSLWCKQNSQTKELSVQDFTWQGMLESYTLGLKSLTAPYSISFPHCVSLGVIAGILMPIHSLLQTWLIKVRCLYIVCRHHCGEMHHRTYYIMIQWITMQIAYTM